MMSKLYGECLYHFAVKEPSTARITDIRTGDPEILWLQSMGVMDPYLSFHPKLSSKWGDSQPFGLCHVTLTSPKGQVIWEAGKNYGAKGPYFSHFSDGMTAVDSISDKSSRVLVCGTKAGKGILRIFDLSSGHLQKEIILPRNDYTWILSGRGEKTHGGRMIVLTTQDVGYYPGGHGRHSALFLDAQGSIIKEVQVNGDGHFPACFDADGDGFDEFMLGYDLFDHEGTHLWRAEYWQDKPIRALHQHADQVNIYRAPGDKSWSAIIAGSDAGLYRIDSRGRTIWRKSFYKRIKRFRFLPWPHPLHVQFLCVGKLLPNDTKDYIFVLHNRYCMTLLDMDGKVLWRGKLPENWPGGRPACVGADTIHMGTPMVLWRNPLGNGQDLLIYNEAGWPYAIDGFGEKVVDFSWPSEARQPDIFNLPGFPEIGPEPPVRPDDWGYGYHCLVHDINDDGRDEVLIYDRRFCWVYQIDSEPKNSKTG